MYTHSKHAGLSVLPSAVYKLCQLCLNIQNMNKFFTSGMHVQLLNITLSLDHMQIARVHLDMLLQILQFTINQ